MLFHEEFALMKRFSPKLPRSIRQRYLVAMVLGTALSAIGSTTVAVADMPEATARAVVDINRYCTACWRNAHLNPDCWNDCTQEVFCRLLERLDLDDWARVLNDDGEERREFIRAIDTVKKRTQRARHWSSAGVETLADPTDRRERGLADDREAVWHAAAQLLSDRQQRILQRSFEGWSVQDIASELKLPAQRVSDEKYKAIQKLQSHFATHLS
jgi:RNA polymerase sigma factor (sigma-70 family)